MKNDRLEKIKFKLSNYGMYYYDENTTGPDMRWLINKLEEYHEQLERLSIRSTARK